MTKEIRFVLAAAFAAFLLVKGANAQGILYVKKPGAAAPNGTSWAKAFGELQPALDKARASAGIYTQIWVAEGTYKPTVAVSGGDLRTKTFLLVKGIDLYGGFVGTESSLAQRQLGLHPTVLSGDLGGNDGPNFTNYGENAYQVVRAFNDDLTFRLDGFTVKGGNANSPDVSTAYDEGGGLHCEGTGKPVLRNCIFESNSCRGEGGAVFTRFVVIEDLEKGLDVEGCDFRNNRCETGSGGALHFTAPSTLQKSRIVSSRFSNNRAGQLGGGCSFNGRMTVAECLFDSNEARRGWGGAIACTNGSASIVNCQFIDNSAVSSGFFPADGGAIHFGQLGESKALLLANCEFRGNTATGRGGAVWLETDGSAGFTIVVNCTFAANYAAQGGAVFSDFASKIRLRNSILWGNTAASGLTIEFIGPAIDVANCNVEGGFAGAGNIDADPMFHDLASGDLTLNPNSPCIDFGVNAWVPADSADLDADGNVAEPVPFDLAGSSRLVNIPTIADLENGTPAVDLGAHEFHWVGLENYGNPSSGCGMLSTLYGDSAPVVGNASFHLVADRAPANSLGLLLLGDVPFTEGADPYGLGVKLWVDLLTSTQILDLDFPVSGAGLAAAALPIPNDPAFAGFATCAQGIFAYSAGCQDPLTKLGATGGLRVRVQVP